jgi:two-component system, NtrC family, sensor kinase
VFSKPLKSRILLSMFIIIVVLAAMIAILGYHVIKAKIMVRAQHAVRDNLKAARSFYQGEIDKIEIAFNLVSFDSNLAELRVRMNLHYLKCAPASEIETTSSEIVKSAFDSHKGAGGTRIMSNEELSRIDPCLVEAARIQIRPTQKALPTDKKQLDAVMVKEYALPILDKNGKVENVCYGGRIINRDYELVDKIRLLVFGSEQYHSKPVGTVTIFQDDTRISTNVLDENGQRAIGTRVSAQVYKEVVEKGNVWDDRAFVVNAWYKSAYEPITNINGNIIGIIYVGTLAEPFDSMTKQITLAFMAIVSAATALAMVLSFILAAGISKPLTQLLNATHKLSNGDHALADGKKTGVAEIDNLAEAFNDMSVKLKEREKSLKITNEKLVDANKSYIDLISFVSHELKGILSSAIINSYAVRDGILGMVNFKQRKALDSITRNLDYLESTVHKFLNLGRIEKGDLTVNKTKLDLRKDIFDVSIDSLKPIAAKRGIIIDNEIEQNLVVNADHDLMLVTANNLITNAIKYGREKGRILIKSKNNGAKVEIDVYNDSTPINDEQKDRLFKKFSRLETAETKNVKGTGLGLFITMQIIEKHGGRIWVEPQEAGNSFIFDIERN